MKNILLGLALLATMMTAKAQAPTTQEEYNYATKGLKMQRASGLDLKAGYVLINSNTTTQGVYTIVIEDLVRKADNSLAGTVVEVNNSTWAGNPGPNYFFIPNPSSSQQVFDQYWQAVQAFSSIDIHRAVNLALAIRVAEMTNKQYNKK